MREKIRKQRKSYQREVILQQMRTVNEEGWKIISVETVSPQIKTIGSNDVYEAVKGDTTTKQVYDPDSLPISVTLSPTEPTLIVRYRATGLELPPVRLTGLISKFC